MMKQRLGQAFVRLSFKQPEMTQGTIQAIIINHQIQVAILVLDDKLTCFGLSKIRKIQLSCLFYPGPVLPPSTNGYPQFLIMGSRTLRVVGEGFGLASNTQFECLTDFLYLKIFLSFFCSNRRKSSSSSNHFKFLFEVHFSQFRRFRFR